VETRDGVPYVSWGNGGDRVTQGVEVGNPDEWDLPPGHPQVTAVRGIRAVVIPVGDAPESEIQIIWRAGACRYTVWIGPGLTIGQAGAYANAY
jgi:hypothetical protein